MTGSATVATVRSLAQGVAGARWHLVMRAPIRIFSYSLNEGWNALTKKADRAAQARQRLDRSQALQPSVAGSRQADTPHYRGHIVVPREKFVPTNKTNVNCNVQG